MNKKDLAAIVLSGASVSVRAQDASTKDFARRARTT
jgi:hypothetical protein